MRRNHAHFPVPSTPVVCLMTVVAVTLCGCAPIEPRPNSDREPGADGMQTTLEAAGEADRTLAPPSSEPQGLQNLQFVGSVGASKHPDGHASALLGAGVNYGGPVPIRHPIDYQIGADITKREGDRLDIYISGGLSVRDRAVADQMSGGAALLLDYIRPREDTDLFAVRGLAGLSLTNGYHLGWRGRFPINSDRIQEDGVSGARQRFISRNEVTLGYEFNERFAAEISAGYLGGKVDEPVFGLRFGFTRDYKISFLPTFEVTPEGDYAGVFVVRFEFSNRKAPTLLTKYVSQGPGDHTPYPLQSLTELLLR